ncbi:TetR family transcriptional regulator [Nitrincola sp. A-D6]|uniref:TetR family transcriptional regulator n=1 Tax=Nitrincola sp. A-D6 TaxID=1545442 RepID=UPI00068AC5B2|nr:TetR family transcriptional regulator [Nitrincola sp. A-D6]
MPRRTKEEAEQTRRTLLSSAMALYAERGVNRVSLKEISAACGVTHGALYWHFRNRDDLLQQLYLISGHPFELQYIEQRQSAKQDPVQALHDYLLGVVRAYVEQESYRRAYRIFFTNPELPELLNLRAQIEADQALVCEHIHYFLKQAKKKKMLRKKLPLTTASQALSGVLNSLIASAMVQVGEDVISQARLLVQLLTEGVRS